MKSQLTVLCYIKQDNKYLMLHRIKKEKDINKDKWIGVGGHFEQGESPEECLLREVREEQLLNALPPIETSELGNEIAVNPAQP